MFAKVSSAKQNLRLVESPLGISSTIDPVSLVQCHFGCTEQGIVDCFDSKHELRDQRECCKEGRRDLPSDPGFRTRTSNYRTFLLSGFPCHL
jgi:hypothetical protein